MIGSRWLKTFTDGTAFGDRRRVPRSTGASGRLPVLACLALSLAACSALPKYARPVTLDIDQLEMQDVIRYRPLERSDFKGEQPPPGFDHRMGAAICAFFENNIDDGSFRFVYLGMENYRHVYDVTLDDPQVWALMDRDCSWWNPGIDENVEAYVLEHEEVHFALFELTARKWSEQLETTVFRISGGDESELKRDMQAQFDEFWQSGKHELDASNLEFDEQTSAVFDPEMQKQWLAGLRGALSSGVATGISPPDPACPEDAKTREALARARRALKDLLDRPELAGLVDEAEAAARPPECDPVRARILADKAYRLSTQ